MNQLSFILLLIPGLVSSNNYLIDNIEQNLYNVLDFIDEKYEEFYFDGLLGVTIAQALLLRSFNSSITEDIKEDVASLINKCRVIYNKIYPLLPNEPEYMITFRNKLLNAVKWSQVLSNTFTLGKIRNLGFYGNWTSATIIKNKRASYKGIKSDVCLREILELSQKNRQCHISKICGEMMLQKNRIDSGYLLTHRLLYLQIIKLHGCILPEHYYWSISDYTDFFCSYIYKEAKTSEQLGYPYHDIFLEQVVLCGMEGYAEFLNHKWLNEIVKWQSKHGCYESIGQNNIRKRSSFLVDYGCSDHTTGLGAAALALHLRFKLWIKMYID